jgi:uncharacterized membrane protein
MTLELLFALIIFLAPHAVPSIPGLRPRLIEKFGRAGYLLGYITLSTITFIWLIVATLRAPYLGLWALSPWHVYVVLVLVALGCTLLIAGLATANPLSLSILTAGNDVPKNAVLRITRHPLLWALGPRPLGHEPCNRQRRCRIDYPVRHSCRIFTGLHAVNGQARAENPGYGRMAAP